MHRDAASHLTGIAIASRTADQQLHCDSISIAIETASS
jgi:hypothetical protein